MTYPDRYDLLVILAGNKSARHVIAHELDRRGWSRSLAVTGKQESIDVPHEASERVLLAPTSASTYQDARSVKNLVLRNSCHTVLVITSAYQVDRARLTLRRALRNVTVTVDILAWEPVTGARAPSQQPTWRALARQASELCKLAYYLARRRA